MKERLKAFFVITTNSSLYRVSSMKDGSGFPIIEKIAMRRRGPGSRVEIGTRIKDGQFVGIMRLGIVLYNQERERQRPEDVNTYHWGGKTPPIVSLFLKEEDARRCINRNGLRLCDPRWKNQTAEVLAVIGDNHPVFIVSRDPRLGFPEVILQESDLSRRDDFLPVLQAQPRTKRVPSILNITKDRLRHV